MLITGITGLIGSQLAKYFIENTDYDVYGFKRWRSNENNIASFKDKIKCIEGDITDHLSVYNLLQEAAPDYVYHLAAQSYPNESIKSPFLTYDTNIYGTLYLLEGIKELDLDPKVHIACSSASYGFIDEKCIPINEETPLRPLTPYGISKSVQEQIGYQYYQQYGIKTYMTRFFNQIGPGQNERSSVQSFCMQVALIEKGKIPPIIKVGNLSVKRDFTDVRDTVKALDLLLLKGKPGEVYNIGSGKSISIERILEIIIRKAKCKVEVQSVPERMRKNDELILEGDINKFIKDTGWYPQYQIEETIDTILEYWRSKI